MLFSFLIPCFYFVIERYLPSSLFSCFAKVAPVTARLLGAKNDDNISAAYRVPLPERYAHVLLGYEPLYTSFLQKRKKKSKAQIAAERAGPSRKRKRVSFKGKSVEAVELSSETEVNLHRTRTQDLAGTIREPLQEEYEEGEEEMGGDLGELPSLLPKKTKKVIKNKGTPSHTKRAPANAETDAAELKKQRLELGSVLANDARKEDAVAEKSPPGKVPVQKDAPSKDTTAETSSPVPFIFAPQSKQGQPILITDSVRANPRLGFPVLQGVCLPEDMKLVPSDLEGNIVDMFSHLTLVSTSTELFFFFVSFE